MEGPTVKRNLWRSGSSSSELSSESIPEGDDAQRRMRRLRRRIRLIYADPSTGVECRMTVVRRELPLSKGASRPAGYSWRRIVSARALQSCPHRADAAAPQEAEHRLPSLL